MFLDEGLFSLQEIVVSDWRTKHATPYSVAAAMAYSLFLPPAICD